MDKEELLVKSAFTLTMILDFMGLTLTVLLNDFVWMLLVVLGIVILLTLLIWIS